MSERAGEGIFKTIFERCRPDSGAQILLEVWDPIAASGTGPQCWDEYDRPNWTRLVDPTALRRVELDDDIVGSELVEFGDGTHGVKSTNGKADLIRRAAALRRHRFRLNPDRASDARPNTRERFWPTIKVGPTEQVGRPQSSTPYQTKAAMAARRVPVGRCRFLHDTARPSPMSCEPANSV